MTEIKTLGKIDWDFADASTNSATNTIHPYPAKFIPQIPRHFIEELSDEGETVYEPFLGSGTTAVEANILGRNAIGNDVNELVSRPEIGLHKKRVNNGKETGIKRGNNNGVFNC